MPDAASFTPEGIARSIVRSTLVANVAGAVLDYLYLQFLAPGSFDVHSATAKGTVVFVVSTVLFPVYLTVYGAWAVRSMRRHVAHWGAALAAGVPTPEDRAAALGLLGRVARVTATGWVVAAALYAVLNVAAGQSAANDVRVVTGILLGGAVTASLTYLLAERHFRPVFVAALDGEPAGRRGFGIRARLLLAWLVGSAIPLVAVGLTPFEHGQGGLVSLPVSIGSLALIGLLAGYLLVRATSDSVDEPLAAVRDSLDAVGRGDLSVHVPVDDPGELGRLEAGVNRMVSGLRERRRLEELFGRHVGEAVARRALAEEAVLGGQVRDVSALFVDLIGSTALATRLPPDEVVTVLNRLFAAVVDAVTAEGGWVNKFEGDGALCIFGAPEELADHATRALRAARALRRALAAGGAAADSSLDAGIGVASGHAVAGNVGAMDRYEYTVIGDPVNEAARLSEMAKSVPGRLLATGEALAAAGPDEAAAWRGAGESVLRGRDRPTVLVEPVSDRPGPDGAGPGVGAAQPPATAGTIDTV